ncbi:hypothetical protein, partial [Phocaeicola plebeius]|uniref:hypothetical protein n=1 Tax=Phocaeicola plebeius TaxID=310297 RepID=UPI0026ECDAC9
MKKQKLAVVFAALLTMVGFSSCLNSEDDGITEIPDYAEVNMSSFGSVSFNSMYGWVCVPDKSLTTMPESELAQIFYRYEDADLQSIMSGTSTSKNLPVTLLQDPVYLKRLDCSTTTLPEETKTVSIYSLGERDALVWGNNKYLILAPTILLKKGTTSENLSTELLNHRLTLYYLSAEGDEDANTLKLYLRYEISGIGGSSTDEADETESWASDYNIQYTNVSYVNLQNVISMYKSTHGGSEPEKVTVEYEYNNSASSVPTIAKKQTKT